MNGPQAAGPGHRRRGRVLEIEHTRDDLSDEAVEAVLTELRNLAATSSLRQAYQRNAHTLAELIDAQFVDPPEDALTAGPRNTMSKVRCLTDAVVVVESTLLQ